MENLKKEAELLALITEVMGMFSHDMWAIKYDTEGPYTQDAYNNMACAVRELMKEAHP